MKLYTNGEGDWAGTQADAKKLKGGFKQVEVPVDKAGLLGYLNGASQKTEAPEPGTPVTKTDRHPRSRSTSNFSQYDVHDVVLNCKEEHLGSALAATIARLQDKIGSL